jgi:hypothetical protein
MIKPKKGFEPFSNTSDEQKTFLIMAMSKNRNVRFVICVDHYYPGAGGV